MRNREMLDGFRQWVTANKEKLTAGPIYGRLRRSELEDEMLTPALYKAALDLKSDKILASFTVWGNGAVSVIIMDNATGSELLIDEQELQTASDLAALLDHYCRAITTGGPFVKYAEHGK
jgi:hypothetical protein